MPTQAISYGRCACSGWFESRLVEVRPVVGGEPVVLKNVPQGACPLCGSRVYKADVLRMVEAAMRGEGGPHSARP